MKISDREGESLDRTEYAEFILTRRLRILTAVGNWGTRKRAKVWLRCRMMMGLLGHRTVEGIIGV